MLVTAPKPPMVWNDSMPSVLARMSSTFFSTMLVRSSEAPGGSWTLTPKMPWSSSGMKPAGMTRANRPAPIATAATIAIVSSERRTSRRDTWT